MAERDESFLSRWSRLKQEAVKGAKKPGTEAARTEHAALDQTVTTPAVGAATQPVPGDDGKSVPTPDQPAIDFENLDFDKLDGNSDYRPFMSANVPDEIRNKALNKLWLSDPVLSGPDQLSDYMEDFTDAARAVPPGLLKTAYKVGQGFLSDEEAAEWDRLGRKEPAQTKPATAEIAIAPESPDQAEIAAFLAASDSYAQSLYPPESNHLVDLPSLMAPNAHFFVARRSGKALGCGALIIAEDGWGEVKRMWVAPDARGQGIGRKLLETIETAAREKGIGVLRLETGIKQPEAVALYRSCGFTECEPFGSYQPDPLSLFMEKRLT